MAYDSKTQSFVESAQPKNTVFLASEIGDLSELTNKDTEAFVEAIVSIKDLEIRFKNIHILFSKHSEEYLREQLNFPNYNGVEKLLGKISLLVNKEQLATLSTIVESMESSLQREIDIKDALQNFTNKGDKGFQENAKNLEAVLSVLKVRLAELSKSNGSPAVSLLKVRELIDQHQNGIMDTAITPHEDRLAKIIVDFRQAFSHAGAIERALGKDIFKAPKADVLTFAGETTRLFDVDKCFSPCYLKPTSEVASELENRGVNPISMEREITPALRDVTARLYNISSLQDRVGSSASRSSITLSSPGATPKSFIL
jgi:hypothetical protein